MSGMWRDFWNNYRKGEANAEADLYWQVGKTIGKKPISEATFQFALERILAQLHLSSSDHLFEFCCGNGLVTYELATFASRVTAIDFVEHHIVTARKIKFHHKIDYYIGDALAPLSLTLGESEFPTKFLMNAALAYFVINDLNKILENIRQHQQDHPFLFLLTDIPNFDLKWNFYNTLERRARHLDNEKNPDNNNDGLGRWWRTGEIEGACRQNGLTVLIENQPPELSNYRMDALISSSARDL